jgi:hypothetical protein
MKASWYGTKARWLYHGPLRVKWGKWKWNNEIHIIFLHEPRLLRWAMWPMGLLLQFNFASLPDIAGPENVFWCMKLKKIGLKLKSLKKVLNLMLQLLCEPWLLYNSKWSIRTSCQNCWRIIFITGCTIFRSKWYKPCTFYLSHWIKFNLLQYLLKHW